MTIAIFFVVSLLIGLPIAFVLGGSGIVHAFVINDPNLFIMLTQRTFAAVNSFSLMAIPLFILAGEIMGFGGITEKLCDMMRSFVGHIRGGMAYTTVLVGTALGALLGSANASAALLGDVMYGEMIKDGYKPGFTAGLVAGTSILGPIIPPSMVFIMYGVQANISIAKMFFAGIVPGLMIALAYFIVIGFYAKKENWNTRPKVSIKLKLKSFLSALPALFIPVVILGSILGGIATPTESAATASFAAIFIGVFVYKKLRFSHLPKILERTGVLSGAILLIVAFCKYPGLDFRVGSGATEDSLCVAFHYNRQIPLVVSHQYIPIYCRHADGYHCSHNSIGSCFCSGYNSGGNRPVTFRHGNVPEPDYRTDNPSGRWRAIYHLDGD